MAATQPIGSLILRRNVNICRLLSAGCSNSDAARALRATGCGYGRGLQECDLAGWKYAPTDTSLKSPLLHTYTFATLI